MTNLMTRREMVAMLGAVVVVAPVFAAEQTLKGDMVCAKCFLKKPDAKECQDVLLGEGRRWASTVEDLLDQERRREGIGRGLHQQDSGDHRRLGLGKGWPPVDYGHEDR